MKAAEKVGQAFSAVKLQLLSIGDGDAYIALSIFYRGHSLFPECKKHRLAIATVQRHPKNPQRCLKPKYTPGQPVVIGTVEAVACSRKNNVGMSGIVRYRKHRDGRRKNNRDESC